MKRTTLFLTILAAVAAVGWWIYQAREPEPPAKTARSFSGVRARVADAMYVEEDPASGTVLIIRAGRAVARDGKVGRLFRTPLRQYVELRKVEVELRGPDGHPILTGQSARARFDPDKKRVTLEEQPVLMKDGFEIRAKKASLSFRGELELSGGYGVFREGERIAGGRGYAGAAAGLVVDK